MSHTETFQTEISQPLVVDKHEIEKVKGGGKIKYTESTEKKLTGESKKEFNKKVEKIIKSNPGIVLEMLKSSHPDWIVKKRKN